MRDAIYKMITDIVESSVDTAIADTLTKLVHVINVIHPLAVNHLEQNNALLTPSPPAVKVKLEEVPSTKVDGLAVRLGFCI